MRFHILHSLPPSHVLTLCSYARLWCLITTRPRSQFLFMVSKSIAKDPLVPEQNENKPNWMDLPREITSKTLLRLGASEIILNAQNVCSEWRSICKIPSMWRTIDMGHHSKLDHDVLNKICRMAVDRSSGGTHSINLKYFPNDYTLMYIAHRSKNIRCLQLISCHKVCDEGLCEAVERLPCLEELDLTNCLFSAETIKSVGISCTHLKSFKLNNPYYKSPAKGDAEAVAIAKSMHQLHHLQLFKSKMTNGGLKAILDGCPYLKSLDLRRCVNVNLEGSLGKRCAEMIKNLQLPCDSTIDYPYTDKDFVEDQSEYEINYDAVYGPEAAAAIDFVRFLLNYFGLR